MVFGLNLFGKQETVGERDVRDKESVRGWQKHLKGEMRSIDRMVRKTQLEEEKLKRECKQLAKKGETKAVGILAKNLVRSRATVNKMIGNKAQLNSVSMQLSHMAAQMKLADTMKSSTSIMHGMNQIMRVPELAASMKEMQKEMMKAGLIEEMVGEAMEMDDPDIEDDAEVEMRKVLEELAIENMDAVFSTSSQAIGAPKAKAKAAAKPNKEEDELFNQMNALLND